MNIKVGGSREKDWCDCVSSVHSKDQQCVSEATKYLGPGMSACSHRRACGITEGFLHLSHHFPLLCSTPTFPKVLPRTSVVSADRRLSSYPRNYILPGAGDEPGNQGSLSSLSLHLARWGLWVRGEMACRSERPQGLHATPVLALSSYEPGRWPGASDPNSMLKEYERVTVLGISNCSVSVIYLCKFSEMSQ